MGARNASRGSSSGQGQAQRSSAPSSESATTPEPSRRICGSSGYPSPNDLTSGSQYWYPVISGLPNDHHCWRATSSAPSPAPAASTILPRQPTRRQQASSNASAVSTPESRTSTDAPARRPAPVRRRTPVRWITASAATASPAANASDITSEAYRTANGDDPTSATATAAASGPATAHAATSVTTRYSIAYSFEPSC